jgi:hypothetical protein
MIKFFEKHNKLTAILIGLLIIGYSHYKKQSDIIIDSNGNNITTKLSQHN